MENPSVQQAASSPQRIRSLKATVIRRCQGPYQRTLWDWLFQRPYRPICGTPMVKDNQPVDVCPKCGTLPVVKQLGEIWRHAQ